MRQSIQDIAGKFKASLANDTLFMALLLILVGVGSFGLGRASVPEGTLPGREAAAVAVSAVPAAPKPLPPASGAAATVTPDAPLQPEAEVAGAQSYVGSKNGTKFHLLSCPGASQIKEENKVYFNSKQEAYSKGYTEAANCKGI